MIREPMVRAAERQVAPEPAVARTKAAAVKEEDRALQERQQRGMPATRPAALQAPAVSLEAQVQQAQRVRA